VAGGHASWKARDFTRDDVARDAKRQTPTPNADAKRTSVLSFPHHRGIVGLSIRRS